MSLYLNKNHFQRYLNYETANRAQRSSLFQVQRPCSPRFYLFLLVAQWRDYTRSPVISLFPSLRFACMCVCMWVSVWPRIFARKVGHVYSLSFLMISSFIFRSTYACKWYSRFNITRGFWFFVFSWVLYYYLRGLFIITSWVPVKLRIEKFRNSLRLCEFTD